MQAFSDQGDYFYPYAFITDQKKMLEDVPRMAAYHAAMMDNADHFAGKAVLDCGTGTGILAVWAAQAGARVVYAVEATEMAKHARTLVDMNGLSAQIKVFQGTIETVELPEKVDIIVSEWMGLLLLRDGMLNSVIAARDKWLVSGGSMFPSHCEILLAPTVYQPAAAPSSAPVSHEQVMSEWQDLVAIVKDKYNVDYSCLNSALAYEKNTYYLQSAIEDILAGGNSGDGSDLECDFEEFTDSDSDFGTESTELATDNACSTVLASKWTSLKKRSLCAEPVVIKEFDCHSVTTEELESFSCQFVLELDRSDSEAKAEGVPARNATPLEGSSEVSGCDTPTHKSATASQSNDVHPCNSLTCWFDVWFRGSTTSPATTPRVLSTGPGVPATHWGQQTFMIPSAHAATLGKPWSIQGIFHVYQLQKTHRMYNVRLQFSWAYEDQSEAFPDRQSIEYKIE
ncbi:hypothetical protein CYMTET_30468 [Cymbomonas tetramitiformis]|uniref:type I protein arginine methyltransferase n=1 Tax=Cymbomonas tetramitiformis TaxID=36881 RepID=A0AAE0FIZ0_9CHLO|nr:hypothetical protein CYMTET_30468 [Cymbomonas tetramitiformis]|eukprot:gene17311-20604_t